MSTSTTKRSTPKLSDLARKVVAPRGVVSTGWPAVERKCRDLGVTFRPWQPDVGRLILAKREDGKYASTIGGTGMSIPRQVGKTFLVGAIIFALCLLRPNLTVIWTAHRLRTAEETFGKMQAFAKRKRIAPYILKMVLGSGDEAIIFRNGSRILFGARERGFGRGFDEVDVLIFDEAQILSEAALDDMIPATNQSRQETSALLLFMGTPPKPTDPSEVFTRMRTEALSGEDDDTGWVEFGADPAFVPTSAPAPLGVHDWEQVAKANPSFPEDTPREAILRMRKKLGPESFLREGLGVWPGDKTPGIMPSWAVLANAADHPPVMAVGLGMDPDRVWCSLGGCGDVEGMPFVWGMRRRRNGPWVVRTVRALQRRTRCAVVVDRKGPASSLIEPLEAAGVVVSLFGLEDLIDATAEFYDMVDRFELRHDGGSDVNAAVAAAAWRKVGDRRAFARRSGDIDALEGVTLANWGRAHAQAGAFNVW